MCHVALQIMFYGHRTNSPAPTISLPLVVEYMPTPPKGILQNILGDALISGDAPQGILLNILGDAHISRGDALRRARADRAERSERASGRADGRAGGWTGG